MIDGEDDVVVVVEDSAAVPFHVVPQKCQYSISVVGLHTNFRVDGKLQRVFCCNHPVQSVELSCCY